MSKLSSKQLAELSVEELLNLRTDEIELVQRRVYPEGLYTGFLVAAELPNPSEDINYFNWKFQLTGIVETANPEEMEKASGMLEGGEAQYSERYYMAGGFAVQLMNTRMGDLITGVCGEGATLGEFFGFAQEADPIPVTIMLRELMTKPNKKKGETYDNFVPAPINELGGVALAE